MTQIVAQDLSKLARNSIEQERSQPSFPIREMTYFLDGGEKATLLKEKIMLTFERDPIFRVNDQHDLNFNEIRERSMAVVRKLAHYFSHEPVHVSQTRMQLLSVINPGAWTRVGVHYGLFFNTLRGQATSEQFAYWASKGAIALNGITGCFAMTELGHGSNVAGLETTATFDDSSDEFVIHTPTLTATKFWIGGAAQTATHSVVFAQLIVRGRRYGVKPFVVQLRNIDTFRLMPGIVIGDIGAKMGRTGTDNGWIQFTHVRVPRSHMLMKYTKVLRTGEVKEPPLQQLAYGALIQGRVAMVVDSSNMSMKALTIAVRYACVRRQFGGGGPNSEPETKILDYIIHQERLMPLLAQTYAMHFTGNLVTSIYEDLMHQMESMQPDSKDVHQVIENLKEVHGTSAGLKAFCTWMCLNIIDTCRQSCGGNGYSSYTGLASMYSDFAVQCTWEGDNSILTLQSGRYLIGCYREAKTGKKQALGVSYLNDLAAVLKKKCPATNAQAVKNLDMLADAFNLVCANVVRKAGEDFEALLKKGLKEETAYEECSSARLLAAKIHSFGYLFHRFKAALAQAPQNLVPILTKLCMLYGTHTIVENSGAFLQYQYFSPQQMDWIRAAVSELAKEVRKDAIPLTDAFNLSDYMVNSPLGRHDGNVYESYFDMINKAHKPGAVPSYFPTEIYPLLHKSMEEEDPLEIDDDDE